MSKQTDDKGQAPVADSTRNSELNGALGAAARKTQQQHLERHVKLHKMLDELVADWIAETESYPSKGTVMDLVAWSYEQTIDPSDKHNRFSP